MIGGSKVQNERVVSSSESITMMFLLFLGRHFFASFVLSLPNRRFDILF